ncbi:MAG: hypothetical protein F7B59_02200 [Desulfurococcales archaeon]|nr:hypothetical protein [Desulfurococcales archaeon]
MGLTGIYPLDSLIGSIPRYWILEFYGEESVVSSLLHYITAYRSRFGSVLVLLNKDFGGLDPYTVMRLTRILNGDSLKIDVGRGFRFSDTVKLLRKAGNSKDYDSLVIGYPYFHMPRGLKGYSKATEVTGLARELSMEDIRVFLFNHVSHMGVWMPEGGNYHHHSIHVIVRVDKVRGERIRARIIKHPSKPIGGAVSFRLEGVFYRKGVYQPLSVWF